MGIMNKLRNFFDAEESPDEGILDNDEDIEDNERWISVEITIMTPSTHLIKLKKELKAYAEDLDWELTSGNYVEEDENKSKRYNITMAPKLPLSPKRFAELKDKLLGHSFAIHRDIGHAGNRKKAIKDFLSYFSVNCVTNGKKKPKKKDFYVNETIGFLKYDYPLIEAINLEKRNKKLALEIFTKPIEEKIRSLFVGHRKNKSKKEALFPDDELKDELEKVFDFKL